MIIVKTPYVVLHCAQTVKLGGVVSVLSAWRAAREDQLEALVSAAHLQFKRKRTNAYAMSCVLGPNRDQCIGLVFASTLSNAKDRLYRLAHLHDISEIQFPEDALLSKEPLCLKPDWDQSISIDTLRLLTFNLPMCNDAWYPDDIVMG